MVESESKLHKCFCDWGFGLLLLLFHGALILTVIIMVEKSPRTDSFYIGSYSFSIKPKMNELPLVEVTETIQFQVIGTFSTFTRVIRFSNNTIETGLPSSVDHFTYSSPNVTNKELNVKTTTIEGESTTWVFTFPPRSEAIIITYTYEADLLFNATKDNTWKFNYHLIDDSWSKMNGSVWGFSKIDVDVLLPFAELSNLTMSQDLYGQSANGNQTTLYFKQDYLGLGRDYSIALDFIPGSDENKEHETKKIFGIDWWIFVIAGGVVVIIVAAILISHIVKTRRQKKILILEKQ